MNNFDEILKKLPRSISDDLKSLPASVISEVEEVRLRCGRNIRLKSHFFEKAIAHIITSEELRSTLNSLIKYSFYAYEQDLANGFVTIEGGHRVGVCGKVVIKDGRPALIKEISSLNIRFAKEIKGCADKLTSEVLDDNGKVTSFEEKPKQPKSDLGVPPFYLYKRDTLPLIDEYLKEGNNPDAPGHFIPWLIGKNDVYAYVFDAVRIDIGTPESYYDACEKQKNGTLFNN